MKARKVTKPTLIESPLTRAEWRALAARLREIAAELGTAIREADKRRKAVAA